MGFLETICALMFLLNSVQLLLLITIAKKLNLLEGRFSAVKYTVDIILERLGFLTNAKVDEAEAIAEAKEKWLRR